MTREQRCARFLEIVKLYMAHVDRTPTVMAPGWFLDEFQRVVAFKEAMAAPEFDGATFDFDVELTLVRSLIERLPPLAA